MENENMEQHKENEGQDKDVAEVIRRATDAAERLEAANKKHEELIKREENLAAKKMLGGKTDAGDQQNIKTPEQIKKEGAMRFWEGSDIARAIAKHG